MTRQKPREVRRAAEKIARRARNTGAPRERKQSAEQMRANWWADYQAALEPDAAGKGELTADEWRDVLEGIGLDKGWLRAPEADMNYTMRNDVRKARGLDPEPPLAPTLVGPEPRQRGTGTTSVDASASGGGNEPATDASEALRQSVFEAKQRRAQERG
jgi:hypothetical protein